jgi:hypothetical protein
MAGGGDSSGEVGGLLASAGDEGRGSFETTISEAGEAIPCFRGSRQDCW